MMKRVKISLILCLLAAFLLSGISCGKNNMPPENYNFYLYFKDISSDSLKKIPADLDDSMDFDIKISSIWGSLCKEVPDASLYVSPVPKSLNLRSYSVSENDLILDFPASDYPSVSSKEELILRSALVLTFTQLEEIATVEIRTDGNPIIGPQDRVIGAQSPQNFTDALNSQFSDIMTADVVLYFADETGKYLVPEETTLAYPNTMSLHQALILNLIRGPENSDEGYPVLPSDTKLISVTLKDGVCHVNLNNEILNEPVNASPEVQIYAIVNSLTEINSISEVMISVNGSSNLVYADTVDLSIALTRNLDLIKK